MSSNRAWTAVVTRVPQTLQLPVGCSPSARDSAPGAVVLVRESKHSRMPVGCSLDARVCIPGAAVLVAAYCKHSRCPCPAASTHVDRPRGSRARARTGDTPGARCEQVHVASSQGQPWFARKYFCPRRSFSACVSIPGAAVLVRVRERWPQQHVLQGPCSCASSSSVHVSASQGQPFRAALETLQVPVKRSFDARVIIPGAAVLVRVPETLQVSSSAASHVSASRGSRARAATQTLSARETRWDARRGIRARASTGETLQGPSVARGSIPGRARACKTLRCPLAAAQVVAVAPSRTRGPCQGWLPPAVPCQRRRQPCSSPTRTSSCLAAQARVWSGISSP